MSTRGISPNDDFAESPSIGKLPLKLPAILVFAIVSSACDSGHKPESKPQPQLFKEERRALEQAKGVQNKLDTQAEEARKKLDEAEK